MLTFDPAFAIGCWVMLKVVEVLVVPHSFETASDTTWVPTVEKLTLPGFNDVELEGDPPSNSHK